MEGREERPPRAVPTTNKGKGKAAALPELPPLVEKVASPPSLEALITDSSLSKEPFFKDPNKELGFVYEKEVTKKVQDLLRDSTSFQMATSVSLCLYFLSLIIFFSFFFDNFHFR